MRNKQILVDLSRPPPLYIPPGFNGQITTLNRNDVLCGKGSAISNFPGNVQLRTMAGRKKAEYLNSSIRMEKAYICAQLVLEIRSLTPPGRFLKADKEEKCWIEIGDEIARKKVAQVLRESACYYEEKNRPFYRKQPANIQQSFCPPVKSLLLPQDVLEDPNSFRSAFSTSPSNKHTLHLATEMNPFGKTSLNVL
jgi:hypothetical protein